MTKFLKAKNNYVCFKNDWKHKKIAWFRNLTLVGASLKRLMLKKLKREAL
jgi:hypothetical protein